VDRPTGFPFFIKDGKNVETGHEEYSSLSREQQIQVRELVRLLSPENPHTLVQYGSTIQDKLARLADSMLSHVRARQAEEQIGSILHALLDRVQEIKPDTWFTPQRGLLIRLFSPSPIRSKQKLLARCQKTNHEIERMADTLERLRHQMLRDTTMLDVLYARNKEYFNELTIYIAAAKEKVEEVREKVLPALREKIEAAGNDPLQMQKLIDMERFADRLEKKVQDLLISQTIALQTAPQIRLIQENYEMLMGKIHSSVLTTIPLWKSQMVSLLHLFRQQSAYEVTDRTAAELSAFKQVQNELRFVLEETLYIQRKGSEKNRQIEQELTHIGQDMSGKISRAGNTG
jgi:uncharacterized protein YaaN involved in tellurite resistance